MPSHRHTIAWFAVVIAAAMAGCGGSGSSDPSPAIEPPVVTPPSADDPAPGAAQIAASQDHSCVVTLAGAVRCWGLQVTGAQFSLNVVPVATEVATLSNGSVLATLPQRLAVGGSHACAILGDGAAGAVCWGAKDDGQLGMGPTLAPGLDASMPVAVAGLAPHSLGNERAVSLAAGSAHSCAVAHDGARKLVLCWGDNSGLQLGTSNDLAADVLFATPVASVQTDATITLAAGSQHTCGVFPIGDAQQVLCWGGSSQPLTFSASGQVIGSIVVDLVGGDLPGPISAIAAGGNQSCAIVGPQRAVMCWQVGTPVVDNSIVPFSTQLAAAERVGLSGVQALALGSGHACAMVDSNGSRTVRCWGRNDAGQLGQDPAQLRSSDAPVTVPGVADPVALAAGADHTCALLQNARVMCWGSNRTGQIGNGAQSDQPVLPVQVQGI